MGGGGVLCAVEGCCVKWRSVMCSGGVLCAVEWGCLQWTGFVYSGGVLCAVEGLRVGRENN